MAVMTREQIINSLVENSCCYGEEDREELGGLSDNMLKSLHDGMERDLQQQAVINAAQQGFDDQQGDSHVLNVETGKWEVKPRKEGPVNNTETKPMTEEEWMAQAPEAVRNTLAHAQQIEKAERDKLAKTITANKRNKFQEAELNAMRTPMLQSLAALAEEPTEQKATGPASRVSFFGATQPVVNKEDDDKDVLPIPTINWKEGRRQA